MTPTTERTDPRLATCLDRWDGILPEPILAQVEHLRDRAETLQGFVLASIARICRMRYQRDRGGDHWRTPTETWENRGGDCEDIAILTGAMIKSVLPDLPLELVLCQKRTGHRQGHAVLYVKDMRGGKDVYFDNEFRTPYGQEDFDRRYRNPLHVEWPQKVPARPVDNTGDYEDA